MIRGGGWDPDLFLRYDPADTAQQIALMKSMGLNTIRLEGHFMPPDFYQQMDAAGILVNVGYQCCDEWENSGSAGTVYQNTATTQGAIWRNHPSIFSFQWSDNSPTSTQESQALNGFAAADYPGPFISSAEYNSSPQLGVSGEKEGPYDWVPSNYWYDTSHYPSGDSTLTNAGGAWGFDSEQSAGDTVPTLDSINRFLSASDQSALWQTTAANQYHANYEGTSHSGYAFGTLYNLDQAVSKRYGTWSSLAQYVQEAQAQNYEDTRAQFEAYIAHSTNTTQPSTGTIYWQMNKGWPTLLWSLYNNDYDQAGAYFGAQEANRTAARDLHPGQPHRDRRQPVGPDAVRRDRRVEGLQHRGHPAGRPDLGLAVPGLAEGAEQGAHAEAAQRRRHGVLRRAAGQAERHRGRPQRLLGLDHAGRGQLGLDDPLRRRQPAGHDELLREPQRPAEPAAAPRSPRPPRPPASPARTARTAWSRSPSPTSPRPRPSASCSARTCAAGPPPAPSCPGTTR